MVTQTHRQTDQTLTYRQVELGLHTNTDTETDRYTDRQTHTQTDSYRQVGLGSAHRVVEGLSGRLSLVASTGWWKGQAKWCLHRDLIKALWRNCNWFVALPVRAGSLTGG